MIAVDTNVLLRFFINDDAAQYVTTLEYFQNNINITNPAFISSVTLAEFIWALKSIYKYPKNLIAEFIHKLLTSSEIFVEHEEEAAQALNDYRHNKADFADYYIAHISKKYGATKVITFDKAVTNHNMFEIIK